MNNILKFLASIKIAVFIIASLAILTAVGTFVEAQYDMHVAAKTVYKTWWMYSVLSLLAITLAAVMVDRWPWKKKHLPFLLAHIGILTLLVGSAITFKYGIDGSIRFVIGQKSGSVITTDTEISVWSTFDGNNFTQTEKKDVDFYKNPPEKINYEFIISDGKIKVLDYWPFASSTKQVVSSDSPILGSALRFNLKSSRFNTTDWIVQAKKGVATAMDFGPAKVSLGPLPITLPNGNALYFYPNQASEDVDYINYLVTYKDPRRKQLKGIIKEGDIFQPGWMDVEVRILRYFPIAEERWDFKKLDRPNQVSTSMIKIQWLNALGKERIYNLQLNDVVKLFSEESATYFAYSNKRIDLGFQLHLKNFEVGRYQGTNRAASYQSLVTTPENQEVLISMNEPLKFNGYTFYQASFQDGPNGVPIASILSVNQDPGRVLKYLGSLIICIGMILLYYNRRKSSRSQAPAAGVIK